MNSVKTDNSHIEAKLALRRHFLNKYHAGKPISVFDACQGGGAVWSLLRKEYKCRQYWGVDVKKKKGRLQIDSSRILAQPGWDFDVIDVDVYGMPWKHYFALLPNLRGPATVFLTVGLVRMSGGGMIGRAAERRIGLSFKRRVPPSLVGAMAEFAANFCLAACWNCGVKCTRAAEAETDGRARYIGLRLEP